MTYYKICFTDHVRGYMWISTASDVEELHHDFDDEIPTEVLQAAMETLATENTATVKWDDGKELTISKEKTE